MKKVDARVERNTLALNTLMELIHQVHKSPDSFKDNKELIQALKSQVATAGLEISFQVGEAAKTTSPMSLNTLKTYAERHIPTGFDGFNRLRVSALEAVEASQRRTERSNKRTKLGLTLRVEELVHKLSALQRTNMVLLQALNRSLDDIKSVRDASTTGVRALRATEAIKALSAITSLNAPPFNRLTNPDEKAVINLDEYR